MSSYFKHWGSSHSNRMRSELHQEFPRELESGLHALETRNERRTLAKRVSNARSSKTRTAEKNTLAERRGERPMNAAAGCGA